MFEQSVYRPFFPKMCLAFLIFTDWMNGYQATPYVMVTYKSVFGEIFKECNKLGYNVDKF